MANSEYLAHSKPLFKTLRPQRTQHVFTESNVLFQLTQLLTYTHTHPHTHTQSRNIRKG